MEGFDTTCVIFSVCGVFGDGVGLDMGCRDGNGGGDGFLRESEGKRLVNGFGGGDSRRGDKGDRDGGVNSVGHGDG